MEQLEKLIHDKQLVVEASLAAAQASASPEQLEAIKAAFAHFDKHSNGELNEFEFTAALRSLDCAVSAEGEAATFARLAHPSKAARGAAEGDEGGDEGGDDELLGVALRPVVPHEDEDEDEEELIE